MKKWQEERNYRRVRNEAGEVIANIITVDGMDVEVPEDVYLAYSQADRRERYITEEQSSGKLLSLEQMEEDALLPDYVGAETAPSAETEALEREEFRDLAEQKQILLLALLSLTDDDRELINALFFDGASTREYAQRMGVSQRAVIKRRDRILRDLKKFFENSSDNRLKAYKLIDHIFQDLLPAHGMAQRPEQIQLSHRMLDAMQDGRIALCDAGTGIGKTYAYLAAATAASAFPTGQIARPIIISTSSIALQNAVLTEYLPLLSCVLMADGILTKPLKAVIRKGKSHYVCDERLDRRLRQVYPVKKNPEALAALRTLKETLDMDRVSHLSGYDRERVCVPQVCDCKQRDCRYQRFLKTCDKDKFLFQICNHNLLVADAIHHSEGKRPIFPEHGIIIVDEAHKLPETAQQMLGVTLAAEEIRNLILQLKEERYLLAAEMLEDSTGPLLRKLAQSREEAEPVKACLRLLTAPSRTLPIIQRQIGSVLSPLGSCQLNTVLDTVKLFTSPQTDMIFYTAEDVSTGGAMLCAAAGDITQRMKKILWQPDQAFVLTSGTMAVGSDFRRFKTQAGLEKGHRVMESVSPSPFDYRNNCLLYLPQIPPRQRAENTDVYFDELTAELVGLIKAASGHALVLFTSYAAMSAVKERLREESLPFPLLTLGRNAPHIIEQFRHTPGAVLLATGAAWEGFDFPGDCVSLLVIPRLPFAYPDARKERELEKYSSLRAFIREVAVPEMQIKLRQGFGRAIRTESDTCVIAILDERACRGRRYAQAVSEALPEMRRTGSLREVTRFLREKKPESYFEVER